jgi:hypothetical protein
MNDTHTPPPVQEIYRQLLQGLGHQWVSDDNVPELIEMASTRGDRLLEVELREWQAPCAPSIDPQEILHGTGRPGKPLSP